jgi:hypothetical protein
MKSTHVTALVALTCTLAATGCGAESADSTLPEAVGEANEAITADSTIRSLPSFGDKCISTNGNTYANGTPLILWDCLGQDNQRWTLLADGTIRGYGGKCLSLNGGVSANGVGLILWDCLGQPNQKWTWTESGAIRGLGGRVISTYGYTYANGTRLVLWDDLGQDNQKWSLPYPTARGSLYADGGYILKPGEIMYPQDVLVGWNTLIMQDDCNLVQYSRSGDGSQNHYGYITSTTALWATYTQNRGVGCWATMQTDGNFVVYDVAHNPIWSTNTAGHPGAYLRQQYDGNLVVYSAGGTPLWAAMTVNNAPACTPQTHAFCCDSAYPQTLYASGCTLSEAAQKLPPCAGMLYNDMTCGSQMHTATVTYSCSGGIGYASASASFCQTAVMLASAQIPAGCRASASSCN